MIIRTTVCLAAIALIAGTASADFTHIRDGGTGYGSGEARVPFASGNRTANVMNLLARTYGGTTGTAALFNGGAGRTSTDGTVTSFVDFQISNSTGVVAIARRMSDTVGTSGAGAYMDVGSANWNTANVTDQVWKDGVIATHARGVFAGDAQNLFTISGESGPRSATNVTDHRLGNTGQDGFDPPMTDYGNPVVRTTPLGPFRWLRASGSTNTGTPDSFDDVPTGHLDYSRQSDNASNDQMVTFQLFGPDGVTLLGGLRRFMMFFEDRFVNQSSDRDFNDLAVELTVSPVVIPLPPAAYAGLGSLACVGLFGMIRRRKLASA